jgi:ATP-dependent 26S proteasome regulatory subunit
VHIEFPVPDEEQRALLWRLSLPAAAPVASDVDLGTLARRLPITGGQIANACLAAAFLAAHEGRAIGMQHLVRAVARERRKEGKLPSAGEFGEWLHVARVEG